MTSRVALITGCGKRDGMGRAIASTLAASGVAVVVTDKQPSGVPNRRQENHRCASCARLAARMA